MKRRDLLKGALIGTGLLSSGLLPRSSEAGAGNLVKMRKRLKIYKIDAYSHFAPLDYITLLEQLNAPIPGRNSQRPIIEPIKAMWDVNDRLKMMDDTGIDLSIFIPQPFIETAANVAKDPAKALQAAKFINDEMAGIVTQHLDRFKWVALLPTNLPTDVAPSTSNYDEMIGEFERAVSNGAVGACFIVSPTAKPPDHEDLVGNSSTGKQGLYGKAEELNVPLWIHPSRPPIYPDYTSDVPPLSKYYLWLLLDWLLDSSVAMARIVFANVFGNHPNVKIIIHHKGALVPLFQNRLTYDLYDEIGLATGIPPMVSKPYLNHFKKFYVDSVFSGNESFEPEIAKIAYDFFGPDHFLFGTDAAFSTNDGRDGTMDTLDSVLGMQVHTNDLRDIFSKNILKIIPH
jgi:predicted TIM-barrel fold metal-dependent hydrolase